MSDHPNINAAYRLLMLLEAALRRPHEHTQLRVWADVFQVQELAGRQQKQAVVTGIILMYKQLDRVVEQLKAAGHPDTTYTELVSVFDTNISPEFLNHAWKDFALRLQSAKYPLTIIDNFLSDEENPIDAREFAEVREELEKLEKSLDERNLPRGSKLRQVADRNDPPSNVGISISRCRGLSGCALANLS
jgi:hypothetical protein